MSDLLSQGPIFLVSLIFMLGVVVVVHEYGHYLAGRIFGAAVESFSVGFGKPIVERRDERGTRWRLNWIPIGGFVKFVGESQLPGDVGEQEIGPVGRPFMDLSVGARSIIALAGPVANFVLASLIFSLVLLVHGRSSETVVLTSIMPDGPAAEAGFQDGDRVTTVNGKVVNGERDFTMPVRLSAGTPLTIGVDRGGQPLEFTVTPERGEIDNGLGQIVKVGLIQVRMSLEPRETVHFGPVSAIWAGVVETGDTIAMTGRMLGRMATGKEPISNLSGPVGIGDTGRRIVNQTLGADHVPLSERISSMAWVMVQLCAYVSVGIGLFNLLPLPVLDGGHLVFNAYEAMTGKVLPEKVQEASLTFGLILLVGVAVVVTWGDILETGLFGA